MHDERWKLEREKGSPSEPQAPSLPDIINDEKFNARVRQIAAKHRLELDSDAEELIRYIAAGGYVQGIGKILDRDWALNQALRFWASFTGRSSTRQRAFEFICELLGLRQATKGSSASQLIDVAFDVATDTNAQKTQ